MREWKDIALIVGAMVVLFCFFFVYYYLKVEAYGGDSSCLFIKCRKVILVHQ